MILLLMLFVFQIPKMSGYQIEERGSKNSLDYRVFFKSEAGEPVSPLHDIPFKAGEYL